MKTNVQWMIFNVVLYIIVTLLGFILKIDWLISVAPMMFGLLLSLPMYAEQFAIIIFTLLWITE